MSDRSASAPAVNVSGLVGDSIVDGPGLRFAIFCQGCPHRCDGCHNPQTLPFEGGTPLSADALYAEIKKYPLCRGVTFSGGEPFSQAKALLPLAHKLRHDGYELAAYTGFYYDGLQNGSDAQKELLALLDVLIDGPFEKDKHSGRLLFKGSTNQRVINVPASLEEKAIVPVTAARWVGP